MAQQSAITGKYFCAPARIAGRTLMEYLQGIAVIVRTLANHKKTFRGKVVPLSAGTCAVLPFVCCRAVSSKQRIFRSSKQKKYLKGIIPDQQCVLTIVGEAVPFTKP
jgi:hypothetical protein